MKKLLAMIIVSAMMLGIAPLSAFSGISSTSAVIAEAKDSSGNTAMMGDVDCDKKVSSADARLVLRASVGLEQFTDSQKDLADVDFDKKITSADARLVLRASVGLETLSSNVHEHTFVTKTIKATCTEKGYTEKKCSVCGYIEKTNYTDALGHKWNDGKITTAASCTKNGEKTFTCSVCKETKKETIKATGHKSVVDKAIAATCTKDGKTEGSHCSVCGAVLTAQSVIKAVGHKLSFVTKVDATTTAAGNVAYYHCSVCGKNFKDEKGNQEITDVVIPKIVPASPLTAKEIYNQAIKYTVEINVEGRNFSRIGTGFVYSSDGKIVTNYHVIDGATSISVTDANGKQYSCTKIIGYDEYLDIAIIQINATGLTVAPLCDQYDTGDVIYTLGSSEGLSFTISEGLVSNKKREYPDYKQGVFYIQISAPTSHGNSGGPLIDSFGRVIGINSWGLPDGQNLNFSLPISYISQISIKNISAEVFYNKTHSKRAAYNSLMCVAVAYGEYVQVGANRYSITASERKGNGTIYYLLSYWLENSDREDHLSIAYSYEPDDKSYPVMTGTVYIDSNLFIEGQFVIKDRNSSKYYYSYSLINPEKFVPYQEISFFQSQFPPVISSEEQIALIRQVAGQYFTEALFFAQDVLDYYQDELKSYKMDGSIADLGFVNFFE